MPLSARNAESVPTDAGSIRAHGVMALDGRLLTHGMVDRFKTGPFVARTFGLRHVRRTGDHVVKLLHSVGFQTIAVFDAPMRVYPVLVASR